MSETKRGPQDITVSTVMLEGVIQVLVSEGYFEAERLRYLVLGWILEHTGSNPQLRIEDAKAAGSILRVEHPNLENGPLIFQISEAGMPLAGKILLEKKVRALLLGNEIRSNTTEQLDNILRSAELEDQGREAVEMSFFTGIAEQVLSRLTRLCLEGALPLTYLKDLFQKIAAFDSVFAQESTAIEQEYPEARRRDTNGLREYLAEYSTAFGRIITQLDAQQQKTVVQQAFINLKESYLTHNLPISLPTRKFFEGKSVVPAQSVSFSTDTTFVSEILGREYDLKVSFTIKRQATLLNVDDFVVQLGDYENMVIEVESASDQEPPNREELFAHLAQLLGVEPIYIENVFRNTAASHLS